MGYEVEGERDPLGVWAALERHVAAEHEAERASGVRFGLYVRSELGPPTQFDRRPYRFDSEHDSEYDAWAAAELLARRFQARVERFADVPKGRPLPESIR